EPYWLVHATFDPRYAGLWFEGDETRIFGDPDRAPAIAAKVTGKDGVVESVERKEQKEIAPLLYDLTSLQRDANRRFGFSARRTLQAAQSLYEGKKAITYPRTSSRYLAVFHPPARYQRTTVITAVEEERCRTRGKITLEAGWRGVYGLESEEEKIARQEEEGPDDSTAEIPALEQGQTVRCVEAEVE